MKKCLFLVAALVMGAAMIAPQGATAQSKIIKVQGQHPHELLTRMVAEGKIKLPKAPAKKVGEVVPGPQCWAGHLDPTITSNYVDTAYLIVKWTDGKREGGDSLLIWGYVWNTISIYTYPDGTKDTAKVTAHSIDMLRAVANADCRFTVLLQQTGVNGYTIGGIGYNYETAVRVPLHFELDSAIADSLIKFRYYSLPNCAVGQRVVPYQPQLQADDAINTATGEGKGGIGTGIIEHPFNVNYGYPAYDYDWWVLDSAYVDDEDYEWQAGWYHNGYWSFYSGENKQVPVNLSPNVITTRVLENNSVDGFVFAIDFVSSGMSGKIITAYSCECNVCPPVPPRHPKKGRK
jgi:hypothetical protein